MVRGPEDRGRDRRGVHVPAAEGLRVLPRLHSRNGCRGRRRPRSSGCAKRRRSARRRPTLLVVDAGGVELRERRCRSSRWSRARRPISTQRPGGRTTSRSGSSRPAAPASRRRACTRRGARWSATRATRGACSISAPTTSSSPVPKLFFGYARDLAALFPFGVGATGVIFAERTTPELLFELIARYRPTILVNVPTMMQAMLDHPSAAAQDLSCLRLCTSAGEALPEPLHHRWNDAFGVEVLDGIGSSEAYHIYISNRPGRVRPGSIGEVVPGYDAEVVDDAGRAGARRADRPALGPRRERGAHVLGGRGGVGAHVRRRPGHERGPRRARRRRVFPVSRTR